jgi:hypothetical protein
MMFRKKYYVIYKFTFVTQTMQSCILIHMTTAIFANLLKICTYKKKYIYVCVYIYIYIYIYIHIHIIYILNALKKL